MKNEEIKSLVTSQLTYVMDFCRAGNFKDAQFTIDNFRNDFGNIDNDYVKQALTRMAKAEELIKSEQN